MREPLTQAEITAAYRADALFDAHRDDPQFGYRFLADEARDAGWPMAERTAWRICRDQRWWAAFGKKKRRGKTPGPPVHDDLVRRAFTADEPNRLWLADITEHPTLEGTLYLCAVKDAFSGRIVGYSISDRMKARLAVDALEAAVARRTQVAGCIFHTDRGWQFQSRKLIRALGRHRLVGSMGNAGAAGDNAAMESFFSLLQKERPGPSTLGDAPAAQDRDRHLDRTHLPPPTPTTTPRPIDPHRIRDHHDPVTRTRSVTTTCHLNVQQTRVSSRVDSAHQCWTQTGSCRSRVRPARAEEPSDLPHPGGCVGSVLGPDRRASAQTERVTEVADGMVVTAIRR
jgi:transposase InsO family protein